MQHVFIIHILNSIHKPEVVQQKEQILDIPDPIDTGGKCSLFGRLFERISYPSYSTSHVYPPLFIINKVPVILYNV